MRSETSSNFLKLSRAQGDSLGALCCDAVPDVLGELDALSDGELEEIGSGLAHDGSTGQVAFRRTESKSTTTRSIARILSPLPPLVNTTQNE